MEPSEKALANPRARSAPWRWLRRFAWFLVTCVVLGVAAYAFRGPLLIGLAKWWVINDSLTKSDAIVVLGGGIDTRPFEAVRLYHDGFAPKILYMDVRLTPASKFLPEGFNEGVATHGLLTKLNVPETAMEAIGRSVASTYDESLAMRDWVERHHARSIIITTDLFHTRRARWIFRRELRGLNVRIEIKAADGIDYGMNDWWRHESGLIAFETEVIKSMYYHWHY